MADTWKCKGNTIVDRDGSREVSFKVLRDGNVEVAVFDGTGMVSDIVPPDMILELAAMLRNPAPHASCLETKKVCKS